MTHNEKRGKIDPTSMPISCCPSPGRPDRDGDPQRVHYGGRM